MTEVLISVIVPVYNTAPWLRRCLGSICAQTYRNLEILCVNDGSTDNSAEILAEYAAQDSRIKVFTQENAGLSAARNTALAHATGEWVTGVDSDDYLEPGVYERVMEYTAEAVDMVCYGVVDVDEAGAFLPFNAYFDLPAAGEYEMTPELAERLNVCFWSKLWRRSLLEENNLRFPHGLVHEDEALYYLAAPYVRNVAICPEVGYHYVQRQGSIMNSGAMSDAQRVARYVPVFEYVCREYEKRGIRRPRQKAYMLKFFLRICSWYYGNAEVMNLVEPVLRTSGVYRDDYRLERLLPVRGWRRWFLSRYEQSKVYCLFGVAIRAVIFAGNGERIGQRCLIWDRMKKILFR